MTHLTLKICHPVSVFTKTNPVGVDKPIQAFQQVLYTILKKTWGITTDTVWDCYGRAYKNQTADGNTPEVYKGNNEYKDAYFDDALTALSFFSVGDTVKYQKSSAVATVSLVMMVNVSKIKPSNTQRQDEEVRNDVEKFCRIPRFTFEMQSFETGMDTVFKDYSGWKKTDGIKFRDLHPWHCFKINFNVVYNIDNN